MTITLDPQESEKFIDERGLVEVLQQALKNSENDKLELVRAYDEMAQHFYRVVKEKFAGDQYREGERVFDLYDFATVSFTEATVKYMRDTFCLGQEALYEDIERLS